MSTAVSAGMQAALLIREKQRLRRKKFRRSELPSHVATKHIAPFPQYPPESWIHDTTFGGSTDDEDFFNVYHQSAAANALLYVGLGTIAIGSVIFFVGTGDKGFKTLELRLIGPTLIACGLLCCLIRVLLCACPSKCVRRRKKTRLKNVCPHNSSRYPLARIHEKKPDFVPLENTSSLKQKKKVCISTSNPIPSTSTMNFQEAAIFIREEEPTPPPPPPAHQQAKMQIPIINVPDFADFNADEERRLARADSIIELQNLELSYDLQSLSSNDSDTVVEVEAKRQGSKFARTREPVYSSTLDAIENVETSLSVVIEKSELDDVDDKRDKTKRDGFDSDKQRHSEIVLSPLQLGQ